MRLASSLRIVAETRPVSRRRSPWSRRVHCGYYQTMARRRRARRSCALVRVIVLLPALMLPECQLPWSFLAEASNDSCAPQRTSTRQTHRRIAGISLRPGNRHEVDEFSHPAQQRGGRSHDRCARSTGFAPPHRNVTLVAASRGWRPCLISIMRISGQRSSTRAGLDGLPNVDESDDRGREPRLASGLGYGLGNARS